MSRNQSEYFISAKYTYAILKIAYDIGSRTANFKLSLFYLPGKA